jgi:hypothetical protein
MFRSIFDHPQGDIFSLPLSLLFFTFPSLVVAVLQQPDYGEHATTSTQSTTSITGMLPQTR